MSLPEISKFKVIEEIGRGGMATVYKAMQTSLNREVALKVLPPYFAHDPEFVERFRREALAVAKLRHPNIVSVHSFHREGDLTYIAMEFIEGGSLQDLLDQNEKLPLEQALDIACQVASALQHAHSRGFLHRDIKPSNILISLEGQAVLTDFGIAKALEGTGLTKSADSGIGTSEYMSPEQAQGRALDGRCDIYALGVVIYEMLTGRAPFKADTPAAIIHKQIYEEVERPRDIEPSIPPEVEEIILKCLNKNPEQRFTSVEELNRVLAGVLHRIKARGATTLLGFASVARLREGLEREHERENDEIKSHGLLAKISGSSAKVIPWLPWGAIGGITLLLLAGSASYWPVRATNDYVRLPSQVLGNAVVVRRSIHLQRIAKGKTSYKVGIVIKNRTKRQLEFSFREAVPKALAVTAGQLKVSTGKYRVLRDDPVLVFPLRLGPQGAVVFHITAKPRRPVALSELVDEYKRGFATLSSIRFSRRRISLRQGSSKRVYVQGVLSDGSVVPIIARLRLTKRKVASLSGTLITGLAPGDGQVVAVVGSREARLNFRVVPVAVSLATETRKIEAVEGQTLSLRVRAKFSDGRWRPAKTQWRSANSDIVRVSEGGLLALSSGETELIGSYQGLSVVVAVTVRAQESNAQSSGRQTVSPVNSTTRSPAPRPKPQPVPASCACGGLLCPCSASAHGASCGGSVDGRCRHAPRPRWCPAPHPSVSGAPSGCSTTAGDLHLHQ